jgi:hypothetical protein
MDFFASTTREERSQPGTTLSLSGNYAWAMQKLRILERRTTHSDRIGDGWEGSRRAPDPRFGQFKILRFGPGVLYCNALAKTTPKTLRERPKISLCAAILRALWWPTTSLTENPSQR